MRGGEGRGGEGEQTIDGRMGIPDMAGFVGGVAVGDGVAAKGESGSELM